MNDFRTDNHSAIPNRGRFFCGRYFCRLVDREWKSEGSSKLKRSRTNAAANAFERETSECANLNLHSRKGWRGYRTDPMDLVFETSSFRRSSRVESGNEDPTGTRDTTSSPSAVCVLRCLSLSDLLRIWDAWAELLPCKLGQWIFPSAIRTSDDRDGVCRSDDRAISCLRYGGCELLQKFSLRTAAPGSDRQ